MMINRWSSMLLLAVILVAVDAGMHPRAGAEEDADPVQQDTEVTADVDLVALERKYESLEQELRDMRDMFLAAQIQLRESSPPSRSGSRIGELQRKALAYDTLQGEIDHKNTQINALEAERDEAQAVVVRQRQEIRALNETIAEQTEQMSALEKAQAEMKKNLDLLRMGKFEYYEVKEGDTVESIAALPTVYGDAERHVLIRQVNRGQVEDLDNLVPGEVIVIPRFPASGRYEF